MDGRAEPENYGKLKMTGEPSKGIRFLSINDKA
jgi:hypothetical protein